MKPVGIKEAAKALGFSEYSMRQAARNGRFPFVYAGGRYLFCLEELETCLRREAQENQQKARATQREAGNAWKQFKVI